MIRRISRRSALTTGAAATALTLGCRAQAPVPESDDTKGPGREAYWRNVFRDTVRSHHRFRDL